MRRGIRAAAACVAAGLALAGCATAESDGGKPSVVASTDVWGSVAAAVAGDTATVRSLYTDASGDPHEFSPSASDTAEVVDAQVIVVNGGHYDQYMSRAAESSRGTVIDAYALLGQPGANEHVFYDLTVVAEVATDVADALAESDSANAAAYRANAQRFTAQIGDLRNRVAEIKRQHDGTRVAQTEPLASYLLTAAGLDDVAPAGFTTAVEEGQSPSAADRAAMQDLLTSRSVRAFVYNVQSADPVTTALLDVARDAAVPVVNFTETLPDGVTSYVDWQRTQIEALARALAATGA